MKKRRPPLRRGRGLFAPIIVLVGAATLFAQSWQSHRYSELRSDHSRLLRERQYEVDRLLHLQSLWQQGTSRREIVPRAVRELGMVEHAIEPKDLIALQTRPGDQGEDQSFGGRIRAGFDRYGQVGAARAADDEKGQQP